MIKPFTCTEIKPARNFDASISVPGSKSYTQRALVIAALAEGVSTLVNPLVSEDTLYLANALRDLGAGIVMGANKVFVKGTAGRLDNPGRSIFLGNNGTAMRLLISVAALGRGEYTLTGERRLCERPARALLRALEELGAEVESDSPDGCPPIRVRGGNLRGGQASLENIDSSQYISSLLIAAPYALADTDIRVVGAVPSQPYVDLTMEAMSHFGAEAVRTPQGYRVNAGRRYAAREYFVEGDISSASYFFLAAAVGGGKVTVENVNPETLQGDIGILQVMERFGCRSSRGYRSLEIVHGRPAAGEVVLDMGQMPDMVPTVAALAAVRPGRTVINNVSHLRIKESNRLQALVTELRKCGVKAAELPDGIAIEGGSPRGAEIETYNDHRIAMSFAVLGLAVPGMKIRNPECVGKSFPNFWETFEKLQRQGDMS